MMKRSTYSVLFFSLISICFSCKENKTEESQEILVETMKVTSVSDNTKKEFPFIAQPFRTSELSFRVSGPIRQFDVYAGSKYKQGNIIAEIDPRDFRIRYERSEAIYKQAKAEFERIKVLYDKNNLSASAYEKAQADYTSAKTAYETATNELEDTRLTAPFNGYVGEVYIEKFQDVQATQPIISFIDIDRIKIEIYVTQDIANATSSPDSIQIRFDALPDQIYTAPVAEISKGTTQNNLSYLLTALLPNKDNQLLAGMSGKAILHTNNPDNSSSVIIPQSALCHRPSEGDYVWAVNTETKQVNKRRVKVGNLLPDGNISIRQGLHENENIAVSGLRFLSEGKKITTSEKGKE